MTPPGLPLARPAWLVTLVDLVALVLAMFVLIYAAQAMDAPKWQRIARSLAVALDGDALEGRSPTAGMAARSERPALDLGYLEAVLRDKLSGFAALRVERRRDGIAIVLDGAERATLFDLANVLDSLENRIAVRAGMGAATWEQAIARARGIADDLRAAGYRRPVAALAQPGVAGGEIVVRPEAGFAP